MKLKFLNEDEINFSDILDNGIELNGSRRLSNYKYAVSGSSDRAEKDEWSGKKLNKSSGNPKLKSRSPIGGPYLQPAGLENDPDKYEFMTGKKFPSGKEKNTGPNKDDNQYNVYEPRQDPHRNVAKSKENKKGMDMYVRKRK